LLFGKTIGFELGDGEAVEDMDAEVMMKRK